MAASFPGGKGAELIHDLRNSMRQMIANPGFTLRAVLWLALGIEATAAVFSVIYSVLINLYPYSQAYRMCAGRLRAKRPRSIRSI